MKITMFSDSQIYVHRAIHYLDRHHERVHQIRGTDFDTLINTHTCIYKDIVVTFVTSADDDHKVKTVIYNNAIAYNDIDRLSLFFSVQDTKTRYRHIRQGASRAVE